MSFKGKLRRFGLSASGDDYTLEGYLRARNVHSKFTGNHFHVLSTVGSDTSGYGIKKTQPFASIDYCFTSAALSANNGDVVWCHPGHIETVIAAGGLDLDIAGVTIVFLGEGTGQAYVTFTTDVDADMDVDAAGITLINPKFVTGIDAMTGPIDINAADFTIVHGSYFDAAGKAAIDCVVATAAATRLKMLGWRFHKSTTGTQKESNIQMNGVDDAILEDIDIRGDFGTGNIEVITDEVLNIRFNRVYCDNLSSSPTPALVLDSNCDGLFTSVNLRVATGTTYTSDLSDINWSGCTGFSADGGSGEAIGVILAGGVEGKIDIIDAYHDVATADAAPNVVMSDVIGNKTDAGVQAVTTTKTIMAYTKAILDILSGDTGIATWPSPAYPANGVSMAESIRYIADAQSGTVGLASFPAGAAAANDVSLAEVIRYIQEALDVVDTFHDVAVADAADNVVISDVTGNKVDVAINAVTTTKTIMAYLKGVLNEITVPGADNTDNAFMNDVLGQKADGAAADAVTTTDTIMGYVKQLVTDAIAATTAIGVIDEYHDVPAADNTNNNQINEVIGNKTDVVAAGIVTGTDTLVGYVKQNVVSLNALDAGVKAYVLGSIEGSAVPVNFWWVDANIGESGAGTDPSIAFKTLPEAVAASSNSADDWIFVYDYSGGGGTITMDKAFVHLIGNRSAVGMPYPRIKPASAVPGITFTDTGDRVEIANFVIGGGDQTVPAISFPVGTAAGAYGVYIHDNVIGRDGDAPCLEGIYVAGDGAAPYLVIDNNRFYGSGGLGIAAAGSAVRIAGNAVRCRISNNYISDVGRTATPAIWLDGSVTEPQIVDNRIKFDTDTGTGSAITLGAGVDDGWIDGNRASDGKIAPGNNPFLDGGSTNGWGLNYTGKDATLPA